MAKIIEGTQDTHRAHAMVSVIAVKSFLTYPDGHTPLHLAAGVKTPCPAHLAVQLEAKGRVKIAGSKAGTDAALAAQAKAEADEKEAARRLKNENEGRDADDDGEGDGDGDKDSEGKEGGDQEGEEDEEEAETGDEGEGGEGDGDKGDEAKDAKAIFEELIAKEKPELIALAKRLDIKIDQSQKKKKIVAVMVKVMAKK